MTDIRISIHGDKKLAKKLFEFTAGGMNLKHSMGATGLYLTRFFSGEAFTSRGGVFGRRWPSLHPNYAAWKARMWPGRPPLVRTGLMQSSFKHKSTPLTVSLWNEAEYFKYHQDGRGVPQRVMMRVDNQRAMRIAKYVLGDLTKQMKQKGLI